MGCGHSKANDVRMQSNQDELQAVKTSAQVLQALPEHNHPTAPVLAGEAQPSHDGAAPVLDLAHNTSSVETGASAIIMPSELAAGCTLGMVVSTSAVLPPQTDSEPPSACSSPTAHHRRRAKAAVVAAVGSEVTDRQPEQQLLEAYISTFRFLRHVASSPFQAASDEALWASLPQWQVLHFAIGAVVLDWCSGCEPDQLLLVRHGKVQLLQTCSQVIHSNTEQGQLSTHDSCVGCGATQIQLGSDNSSASLPMDATASELAKGTLGVIAPSSQCSFHRSRSGNSKPGERPSCGTAFCLRRGDRLALPSQLRGWGGGVVYVAATHAVVMALPIKHAEQLLNF